MIDISNLIDIAALLITLLIGIIPVYIVFKKKLSEFRAFVDDFDEAMKDDTLTPDELVKIWAHVYAMVSTKKSKDEGAIKIPALSVLVSVVALGILIALGLHNSFAFDISLLAGHYFVAITVTSIIVMLCIAWYYLDKINNQP